jgi:hypothetical protein
MDSVTVQASSPGKVKVKLASGLIAATLPLTCTDPEGFAVLDPGNSGYGHKIDFRFRVLSPFNKQDVGTGDAMLEAHIGTPDGWGMVRSEIISNFLPPRVKEQFLTSYVLERFQAPDENLTNFVMAVATAVNIVGFAGPETQLVLRMLQNFHPAIRWHFVLESARICSRDVCLGYHGSGGGSCR